MNEAVALGLEIALVVALAWAWTVALPGQVESSRCPPCPETPCYSR